MLLNGIDDEVDLDDDMAHELAKEMWLDVLQANMNSEESIVTFVQYLKPVQENARGFVYKLAIDFCMVLSGRLLLCEITLSALGDIYHGIR